MIRILGVGALCAPLLSGLGCHKTRPIEDDFYRVDKAETKLAGSVLPAARVTRPAAMGFNARPDSLVSGDEVPVPTGRVMAYRLSTWDPDLTALMDRIRVRDGRWRYIVLHHSAGGAGNPYDMDHYHRYERQMENGLAYHFLIGNGHGMTDGKIAMGRRWRRQLQGGHVASDELNESSIGICLVGNFEESRPTDKQMESVKMLIEYLLLNYELGVTAVRTHRQINPRPTLCPGRYFPTGTLLRDLHRVTDRRQPSRI